jgi:hypothetical protein
MTAQIIHLDEERAKRNLSLPRPVEIIEEDWDDVPVFDRALLWGEPNPFERQRVLNRLFEERAMRTIHE